MRRLNDRHLWAALFISFVLVCMKKWEPGGNLDTIWYSAVAKNIAQTGDFFHFFISRNWQSDIYDHMPLTYWITGALMKMLGATDFVARLYPMLCSVMSCMLVYAIGARIKDKHFGLVALVMYGLTVGSSKWNGALLHDVPLTTFTLACCYGFLSARYRAVWLYLSAVAFGLGILTKGPIIGGFGLAVILWSLTEHDWFFVKTRHFFGAVVVLAAVLGTLFLPSLLFDGRSYYEIFYHYKLGYTKGVSSGWTWYFGYWDDLLKATTIILPFLLLSVFGLIRPIASGWNFGMDNDERKQLRFFAWLSVCIIVPLSCFQVKYPHYLLPSYPGMAILSAVPVAYWLRKYALQLPTVLMRVATVAVCIFVMFPVQTSGQRSKAEINLADFIKLDTRIKEKRVIFVGDYADDMIISQTFKFYGSIDLGHVPPSDVNNVNLKDTWLILNKENMPSMIAGEPFDPNTCVFENERFCALTDRTGLKFELPEKKFPHELY